MAEKGNPGSVTDAGVGALAITSCIRGAFLNVKINAKQLDDPEFVQDILEKGQNIESKARAEEEEILNIIENLLNSTGKKK